MRFDGLVSETMRRRMVEVAREFRKEPQPSEHLLWQALRRKQLRGYKFRRQQPIGSFIVDFYCDEAGLIVEVDGPVHRSRRLRDRQRQEILEELGLHVLRVSALDVEANLRDVLARIEAFVTSDAACPSPLGRGVRGEG